MNAQETRKFQVYTAIGVVFLTALVNLCFKYLDNNREDNSYLKEEVGRKVDKTVYQADKDELNKRFSKQDEKNEAQTQTNITILTTLATIEANTKWLVDEKKKGK